MSELKEGDQVKILAENDPEGQEEDAKLQGREGRVVRVEGALVVVEIDGKPYLFEEQEVARV